MDYIERIKVLIKKKNITERKMLDDLGYSKNLIISWRKGSEPSINKIIKIAEYLEVDFAYLITGDQKYNLNETEKNIIELLKKISVIEKNKELARLELIAEQEAEKALDSAKLSS